MNWKNVLVLIKADVKSYRIIRGARFRRFRENKLVTFAMYIGAFLLGAAIGWFAGSFYDRTIDPQVTGLLLQGTINLFVSLPTLVLLYGVVFTQIGQIQRIGVKTSIQPLYWFPITWEERTLASVIANTLGFPSAITIFIGSAIIIASVLMRLVPLALLTVFALLASLFMASATTELSRILQVKLSGAVTKAAGSAAIWVRFTGTILFLLIFYVVYFTVYQQANPLALFEAVAGGQRSVWFIPFVWPGVALSYFAFGVWLETAAFSLASIAFTYVLFLVAVRLNSRFGLYEPPAIRVSRGAYVPRAGLMGRLGFSSMEAGIMRKDFKAFTRRQELIYIFIFPVMFAIMPILSLVRTGAEAPTLQVAHLVLFAYLAMLPGTIMAMILGSMMIGLEGGSVWYIYSSPIAARSLVKAKYSFSVLFSLAVAFVCSVIGGVIWIPSVRMTVLCVVEAVFLIFSLSMVSISLGIKGADFRELPRPRMIRPKWSLINGAVCILLALLIVSPLIPLAVKLFFESMGAPIVISLPLADAYLYAALPISGVIASAVLYMFYRIASKNAEEFLAKAEA